MLYVYIYRVRERGTERYRYILQCIGRRKHMRMQGARHLLHCYTSAAGLPFAHVCSIIAPPCWLPTVHPPQCWAGPWCRFQTKPQMHVSVSATSWALVTGSKRQSELPRARSRCVSSVCATSSFSLICKTFRSPCAHFRARKCLGTPRETVHTCIRIMLSNIMHARRCSSVVLPAVHGSYAKSYRALLARPLQKRSPAQ